MVLGIFRSRNYAEQAILDLEASGFSPKEMSIIMRDHTTASPQPTPSTHVASDTGENVATGAVSGMTTGGVVGGIAGLLIGIGAVAVPGLGGLLVGGPLAAALGLTGVAATTVSGAVTGVLAGGLLGALVGLGLPESDARVYEQQIRDGAILLAVPDAGRRDEIIMIMQDNGAENVRTVSDFEDQPAVHREDSRYQHQAEVAQEEDQLQYQPSYRYEDPYVRGYAGAKGGVAEGAENYNVDEHRSFWGKVKKFLIGK